MTIPLWGVEELLLALPIDRRLERLRRQGEAEQQVKREDGGGRLGAWE